MTSYTYVCVHVHEVIIFDLSHPSQALSFMTWRGKQSIVPAQPKLDLWPCCELKILDVMIQPWVISASGEIGYWPSHSIFSWGIPTALKVSEEEMGEKDKKTFPLFLEKHI